MNTKEREQFTCCLTGHRYLPPEVLPDLKKKLEAVLEKLIQGGCYFGAGGALGFDTMAAELVLKMKEKYPVYLILVLPCRDQAMRRPDNEKRRYEAIREKADKVVFICEQYTSGCMHRRNRQFVDNRSICVAYCTRESGGSAETVRYARRKGLRVINL